MNAPLTDPLPTLPADAWIGKDATGEPIGVVIEDGAPCAWCFDDVYDIGDEPQMWQRSTTPEYVAEILGRWGLAQREIAAAERALRYSGLINMRDQFTSDLEQQEGNVLDAVACLRGHGVDP